MIISFNCPGMKSSYGMVLNAMKDIDCMLLCETRLRPNELHTIPNDMNRMSYWCDMKSSIDPEVMLEGRPYSCVGMICKKTLGVCYISLSTDNDRISTIQIVINEKVYLTVIGV